MTTTIGQRTATKGFDVVRLLAENVQPARGRHGWHGGPTPVGALRGVSAEQARWVPAPGRNSIWQLALHVAYWKYAVRRRLEGGTAPRFPRSPANFPRLPDPADAEAWAADVALLRAEHERLVAVVAAFPASHLDRRPPGRKRWTYAELIVGIAQHDAYHTGQIQVLKRLWETAKHLG
jgi:uncharacterized damage-inducible protein DinB